MARNSVPCSVLALLLVLGSARYAKGEPPGARQFPVPRAEGEFREIVAFPQGAATRGAMQVREYLALAGPFAPLDLQVTRANASEASLLKNFYLGVCGSILKIDTARLANDFHCGPACTNPRKAFASEHLSQLTKLVGSFRKTKQVTLVAQWRQPDSFRVNRMFKVGNSVREAIPSREVGFVPSGLWKEYASVDSFFSTHGIDGAAALALVHDAEVLGVRAITRLTGGAVAVFIPGGLGDNQAGVLFQHSDQPVPRIRTQLLDGLEYVVVEKLAPGVYYFETS